MKDLRLELGITQAEMADLLGISREYLGKIERGQEVPSEKLQYKISKIRTGGIVKEGTGPLYSGAQPDCSTPLFVSKYLSYEDLERAILRAAEAKDWENVAEIARILIEKKQIKRS